MLGNITDTLGMYTHTCSIINGTKMTAKSQETSVYPPNRLKLPNSPVGAKDWCICKEEGLGECCGCTYNSMNMQSDETNTKSQAETSKYTK